MTTPSLPPSLPLFLLVVTGPTWYDRHKVEKREGGEPAGPGQGGTPIAHESTLDFDPSVTGLFGAEDDEEDAY